MAKQLRVCQPRWRIYVITLLLSGVPRAGSAQEVVAGIPVPQALRDSQVAAELFPFAVGAHIVETCRKMGEGITEDQLEAVIIAFHRYAQAVGLPQDVEEVLWEFSGEVVAQEQRMSQPEQWAQTKCTAAMEVFSDSPPPAM